VSDAALGAHVRHKHAHAHAHTARAHSTRTRAPHTHEQEGTRTAIRRAATRKTRSRRGAVRVQGTRKGAEVGLQRHTHEQTGPSLPPGHLLPSSPLPPLSSIDPSPSVGWNWAAVVANVAGACPDWPARGGPIWEPLWSYPHFRIYDTFSPPPHRHVCVNVCVSKPRSRFLLGLACIEMAALGCWSMLFFVCIGARLFKFQWSKLCTLAQAYILWRHAFIPGH
jgi:hypothetical protein